MVEFHGEWCPCSVNICLKERLDNIWLAVPGGSFGMTFQIRAGPLSREHRCGAEFVTTKIVPGLISTFFFLLLLQLAWDDGINPEPASSVTPPCAGDSCLIRTKGLLICALLASQNCGSSQFIANANRWCVVEVLLAKFGSLGTPKKAKRPPTLRGFCGN